MVRKARLNLKQIACAVTLEMEARVGLRRPRVRAVQIAAGGVLNGAHQLL